MDLQLLDSLTAPEWTFEPPQTLRAIFPPWLLDLHYALQLRYRERVDALQGASLRRLARDGNFDAQQLYAHRVYWASLQPEGRVHGVVAGFADEVVAQAARVRGSGWLWLARSVHTTSGFTLVPIQLSGSPPFGGQPALAVDLWEHAWYPAWGIDREQYVRQMLRHLRWDVLTDPRYSVAT